MVPVKFDQDWPKLLLLESVDDGQTMDTGRWTKPRL